MKRYSQLLIIILVACTGACNCGVLSHESDDAETDDAGMDTDGSTDPGREDDGGGDPVDIPSEPDVPPDVRPDPVPDSVEDPDVVEDVPEDTPVDTPLDDDAVEDATPDLTPDPVEDEVGPGCGNGVVDPGEECDNASDFCSDSCELVLPDGWVECTATDGSTAFLFIEDWSGNHTWAQFLGHCEDLIEAYNPEDFAFYGLAVFTDEAIWDCIEPSLRIWLNYYVGMYQDPAAGDYSEPDGGWYWIANNGSGDVNLDAYDPANGFLPASLNDAGGSGSVECGRLDHGTLTGWEFADYACEASENWDGVCMIQF
jgi:hypothetical protein